MCGIAGFTWNDKVLVRRMCDKIIHRGPDDSGYYIDDDVSLGHRRLSIIDLETGHQPIHNEDGSIWIVYNGEIYNYIELRKNLEKKGHKFYTNSDTEVIIHAYEEYGEKCMENFIGMFAFAIWDSNTKKLILARDFIGVKPLYYTLIDENIMFASEIKAILENRAIKRELYLSGMKKFFAFGYITGDLTTFKDIKKLKPGHMLIYHDNKIKIKKYWDVEIKQTNKPEEYYINTLKELFEDSVKRRLMSDVPLGSFLSGGLDSSIVTAVANKFALEKPLNTFSVGFGDSLDNEFKFAKIVSDHLQTNHHEVIADEKTLIKELPSLVWHYDEPNSDAAIFPNYIVSRYAKKYVTVVLAGEGGDEVFGGYYHWYKKQMTAISFPFNIFFKLPLVVRNNLIKPVMYIPNAKLKYYLSFFYGAKTEGDKLCKIHMHEKNIENMSSKELYEKLKFFDLEEDVKPVLDVKTPYLTKFQLLDLKTLLPEGYLMKADKMTMANSIEERVPLLDRRIINFGISLPENMRVRNGEGKYILKQVAREYLPKEIINRKKQGYGVPFGYWLSRGELGDVVEEVLSPGVLKKRGFNPEYVGSALKNRRNSLKTESGILWRLFMFELWYRTYIEQEKIII